jgi:hypothetical protein
MASATMGSILPGADAGAGANESASRGFGGHAEGRHLILRFVEEGVHKGSEPRRVVPGQHGHAMTRSRQMSTNL